MAKKQKIFSKELPIIYETIWDWILLNIVDKFAVASFKEIYTRIANEKEYEGRDEDVEFSQNYWAFNIINTPTISIEDGEKWQEEIKSKLTKAKQKEFDKVFPWVWLEYWPWYITRSKKLTKKKSNGTTKAL